jgi:hypothetical protein
MSSERTSRKVFENQLIDSLPIVFIPTEDLNSLFAQKIGHAPDRLGVT